MASSRTRMRLSVEILPLIPENAHGPNRHLALAAFKGRKFALPVFAEDTFEEIWAQIEHRYKTNYLTPREADAFTIKKLQDAYDCDLDTGDTVGAIFEGETDHTMRVIKVVPTFVDRAFSLPATSNLRPKRLREVDAEPSNKRQRVEQLAEIQEGHHLRDNPVPTTESERSAEDNAPTRANGRSRRSHSRRSHTGASLVIVNDAHTGRGEFAPSVKEESPELGEPPAARTRSPLQRHSTVQRGPSQSVVPLTQEESIPRPADEVPETEDGYQHDTRNIEHFAQNGTVHESEPGEDLIEVPARPSPPSIPKDSQRTPPRAATKRRDIYDVPSSPELLLTTRKSGGKKYGRAGRAANLQKEVDCLNSSRLQFANGLQHGTGNSSTTPILKAARAFRAPEADEIESTPQEDTTGAPRSAAGVSSDLTTPFLDAPENSQAGFHTPNKSVSTPKSRPGSLKTPSSKVKSTISLGLKPSLRDNDDIPSLVSRESVDSSSSIGRNPEMSIEARLERMRELAAEKRALVEQGLKNSAKTPSISASPKPNSREPVNALALLVQPKTPKDNGVFKKPRGRPKKGTTPSNAYAGKLSSISPGLGSTPRSTAAISPEIAPHHTTPVSASAELQASHSSDSKQRGRGRPQVDSPKPSGPPRKRGRPPKSSQPRSGSGATASSPAPQSKKRGSNLSKSVSVDTPSAVIKSFDPPMDSPVSPAKEVPNAAQSAKPAAENIIYVSSSSSSDATESDIEEEPIKKSVDDPVRQPVSPEKTKAVPQDSQDNASGEIEEEHGLASAPQTEKDTTEAANTQDLGQSELEDAQVNESFIQASLGEELDLDGQETVSSIAPLRQSPSWDFSALNKTSNRTHHTADKAEESSKDAPIPQDDSLDAPVSAFEAVEVESKSRSASAVASNRSSPAISRAPARYLSHSPTPEASENESEDISGAPSKAATPQQIVSTQEGDSSDSSSESESDSTDSDDSDEEMSDADVENPAAEEVDSLPSSPPGPIAADSTPIVPSTSQAAPARAPRQTPVPLPSNMSSQVPASSQSVSAQATARRQAARHSGFKSLREQLVDARTKPVTSQKKAYDPRTMNLSKLMTKGKGKALAAVAMDEDDSSEDESSSSSSSDSD